jgi:outer membrane protein
MAKVKRHLGLIAACASLLAAHGPLAAESLEAALAKAYVNNPEINAERAAVRVTDEFLPQAKAGQRPRVSATADMGFELSNLNAPPQFGSRRREEEVTTFPRGYGLQIDQNVWDNGRTRSQTRAVESQILAAREQLRNTEQNVLLDATVAFLNVQRDTAILNLRRNNIEVLEEQLRQTRDRFRVGEVTRTDVAQSEARLAQAQAEASGAEAQLKSSIATYIQVVGVEPKKLQPTKPIDRLLPKTRERANEIAQGEHPAIIGALHGVDAQLLAVRIAESDLLPRVDLQARYDQRWDAQQPDTRTESWSLTARLTVPIYSGGADHAQVRQEKERVGEQRLRADVSRDRVRAAVSSSWGQVEASKVQIEAARAQVAAAEAALSGVREEARVGQRTTLDVLNAQQELLDARVNLIVAQRDRIVATYNLLASIGRLSTRTLKLKVEPYEPDVHFNQVKDKWFGLRTPTGD